MLEDHDFIFSRKLIFQTVLWSQDRHKIHRLNGKVKFPVENEIIILLGFSVGGKRGREDGGRERWREGDKEAARKAGRSERRREGGGRRKGE